MVCSWCTWQTALKPIYKPRLFIGRQLKSYYDVTVAGIGPDPAGGKARLNAAREMQIFSCTVAMSFCLAMYLVTMYPDLAGGDAGELSAAAILGGVPHPPGYPLYAMLGRGFVHLFPFGGSPARQLNLLACFCGAGAASILHWSVLRRTQHAGDASYLAAWTGSLKLLCFSPCEMWILSKFWL